MDKVDKSMFENLKADNKRLKAKILANERQIQQLKDSAMEERHSQRLMQMEVPESTQLTHEEREVTFQETANGIVDARYDYKLDKEMTRFIKEHPYKWFDDGEDAIMLFEPHNRTRFAEALNKTGYRQCTEKVSHAALYSLYYINRVTTIAEVLSYLDKIAKQYETSQDSVSVKPFKISADIGFIVEHFNPDDLTEGLDYTYSVNPPSEYETGRTIPVTITTKTDV